MFNFFKKKSKARARTDFYSSHPYAKMPNPLASSSLDYMMSPGQLPHVMQGVAERNEFFNITRRAISDFQQTVFDNISEGELHIKLSIVHPGKDLPATIFFRLFIGYNELLMEEKTSYPITPSNLEKQLDIMITVLMSKVLSTLTYKGMYKVIEKVDTI